MALKDILVHLDATPRSDIRLAIACDLAAKCAAHLTAIYVIETMVPPVTLGDATGQAEYLDARMMQETVNTLRDAAIKQAVPVEQGFREHLRRNGINGEWRLVENLAADTVALHARYADLAILGQPDPDHPPDGSEGQIVPTTLLTSGRPVLAVPYAGHFATVGQTVVVGWKPSREAARALNDAIPLLQHARAVTILAINPERGISGDGDVPAADIALHLARHGVTATAAHIAATEISEGTALLDYAADAGADLIVMGGFGHSRLHELLFGGATRDLLATMTVPVLISH